jgi:chromosome segregation ATPase
VLPLRRQAQAADDGVKMLANLLDQRLETLKAERAVLVAWVRVLSHRIEQTEHGLLALRCELDAARRDLASNDRMIECALRRRKELERGIVQLEAELRRR